MTALPYANPSVPPQPDLQLHLICDSDRDVDQCCPPGSRRPSSVSLSRIRSCPQLAVLRNNDGDSPCCDMAPITDDHGNIIHMCPALRNNLCVDAAEPDSWNIRSAASTPTPPSSPGSRRNYVITSSCISKSQTSHSEAVPLSMATLGILTNTNSILDTTNHSTDTETEHLDGWLLQQNENLQQYDKCYVTSNSRNFLFGDFSQKLVDNENTSDTDDGASVHISGRFPRHAGRHQCHSYFQDASADDSIDKCNRWLQSLQINTADKMKSRSHIQLPTA